MLTGGVNEVVQKGQQAGSLQRDSGKETLRALG